MSVPEAAVDEDGCFIPGQIKIGYSRLVFSVQAISESSGKEHLSDLDFRPGVFISDPGHVPASMALAEVICHN